MPLPLFTWTYVEVQTPDDVLNWFPVVSRGPDSADVLMPDEEVANFDISPTLEAAALGIEVMKDGKYAPILDSDTLVARYYIRIAPEMQSSPLFKSPGKDIYVKLTLFTNANPMNTVVLPLMHRIARP